MKKKLIIGICAGIMVIYTALLLLLAYPWNKAPKNFTEAKDGVVSIHTEFGRGSGFAIGKAGEPVQYIVTNYHVVFDGANKANEVVVYFSEAANRFMTAQIYSYNANKDLAVLRLPEPTTERRGLTIRKIKDTDTSKSYYALGYPGIAEAGADFIKYDTSDIVTTSGMISKQSMINEVDVYMIDLEINRGNSGGPLVSADGEVVGINTFSMSNSNDEKANYAVCVDELLRIVDPEYVDYTTVGDVKVRKTVVLVLLAAVNAVIILIAVISVKREGQTASAPVNKRPAETKAARKQEAQSDYGVTMAGGPEYGATVAASSQNIVITGLGGVYKGKELKVQGELSFGRDGKNCDVVFPVDTEGVSGHHCVVKNKGGKLWIRDIGSSYGTFINNGLKIDKEIDVELSIGDTFYLGSEKEKFVVKIK